MMRVTYATLTFFLKLLFVFSSCANSEEKSEKLSPMQICIEKGKTDSTVNTKAPGQTHLSQHGRCKLTSLRLTQ